MKRGDDAVLLIVGFDVSLERGLRHPEAQATSSEAVRHQGGR